MQSQAGHADWKTTLAIYTQQSGRSIDPSIRRLLTEFLGDTHEPAEVTRADVPALRERPEVRP